MMTTGEGFLWGASTSAYQVEGGNVLSDWWRIEHTPGVPFERSGDAVDHYHRYREDMGLLADAGLNAYRFGIEWARIEPEPGEVSRAELDHYRRMIGAAHELGLDPVVTLHHFTVPIWFADRGGWLAEDPLDRFAAHVERVAGILDGVSWVCTINEPNMVALMAALAARVTSGEPVASDSPAPLPDERIGQRLAEAHRRVVPIVRDLVGAKAGWTVAQQAFTPTPGSEDVWRRISYAWEDMYLEVSRDDDFVGAQAYTSQAVDANGIVPHPDSPDNTLTGWAYRPDALGIALRHAHEVTGGVPVLVTENGIATADDDRRIAYTADALGHLLSATADGVDVRGYLHWSALDNFEWGHWAPTFGLIAVDRETFVRRPKPSLAWLGEVARTNAAGLAPIG